MTSKTTLPTADDLRTRAEAAARACGVDLSAHAGDQEGRSPINGEVVSGLSWGDAGAVGEAVGRAREAFLEWRSVPAPVRGALVKRFGELLTEHKDDLATLVSIEAGKITSEARGEVQEMIDICDFAVGLSRQLYGRTMASERPGHRLMETWHPLGVVGVISAFNFPVAVWSWNTAIALVCGDPVVWKPSEKTPLCALASDALLQQAIAELGHPAALSQVVLGGPDVGEALVGDDRIALLSATGSTRMGRAVGPVVADRFGRSLLELGGNNAAVVAPSADLDLATRGIVFSAAGTAGQRCTTMRRAIVHSSVVDELTDRVAGQHRHQRGGNRRGVRRRERDRRRPRVRLGRLEGLHATADQHRQLFPRAAAGTGHHLRGLRGMRCPRRSVCSRSLSPVSPRLRQTRVPQASPRHGLWHT